MCSGVAWVRQCPQEPQSMLDIVQNYTQMGRGWQHCMFLDYILHNTLCETINRFQSNTLLNTNLFSQSRWSQMFPLQQRGIAYKTQQLSYKNVQTCTPLSSQKQNYCPTSYLQQSLWTKQWNCFASFPVLQPPREAGLTPAHLTPLRLSPALSYLLNPTLNDDSVNATTST